MKMRPGFIFGVVVMLGMFITSTLYADANLQLYIGGRTSIAEPDDIKKGEDIDERTYVGREYGASFLFVPVPKIPVAIGVFGVQQDLEIKSYDINDSAFRGFKAGVDAMAWLPFSQFQPYLRAGYNLYSQHSLLVKAKGNEVNESLDFNLFEDDQDVKIDMNGKLKGYHAAIGFKLQPIPRFAIIAQAEYAKESFEMERVSYNFDDTMIGHEVSDQFEDFEFTSTSFLAGIELGL